MKTGFVHILFQEEAYRMLVDVTDKASAGRYVCFLTGRDNVWKEYDDHSLSVVCYPATVILWKNNFLS